MNAEQAVEKRHEEVEMRGARTRATGAYSNVREDCERPSNKADRPRSSFATACYLQRPRTRSCCEQEADVGGAAPPAAVRGRDAMHACNSRVVGA